MAAWQNQLFFSLFRACVSELFQIYVALAIRFRFVSIIWMDFNLKRSDSICFFAHAPTHILIVSLGRQKIGMMLRQLLNVNPIFVDIQTLLIKVQLE